MEDAGVAKLYEPRPDTVFLCGSCREYGWQNPPDALLLDHDGNETTTIPHKYSKNKNSCFPAGCADPAAEDGRRGSNVYEVNT
jgi:hypothetical protein